MQRIFLSLLFAFVAVFMPLQAQHAVETNARVPELEAFHKPIYTLWHKAWPEKDIAQLKQLYPDVESAYKTLAAAKLPGILRDKQTVWNEKLAILGGGVKAYQEAIAANDSLAILKSTEDVHMFYEHMVRLIRPVVKELDEFHQVLYLIHHYYLPEYNVAKLKESADSLLVKSAALKDAKLSKRHEAKTEQFKKSSAALAESVMAFVEAVNSEKDKATVVKLGDTMHTRYQMVEKVFE